MTALLALAFVAAAGGANAQTAAPAGAAPDQCPTDQWCFVSVPGTHAGDGSQTGFDLLYRAGTDRSGPLLIELNGGGACWDGDSCDCQWDYVNGYCAGPVATIFFPMHYDASAWVLGESVAGRSFADSWIGGSTDPSTGNFPGMQYRLLSGPTSAFGTGWNMAHIPYTTGDAYSGDAVRTFTTTQRPPGQNITYTIYFKGYSNMTKYLARLKADFPNPSKIVFSGGSAGGMGTECNFSQFAQTWPGVKLYHLNNVGFMFSPPQAPAVSDIGKTWGAWDEIDGQAVADTCPIEPSPGVTPWGLRNWMHYNAVHYPGVRHAYSDDYADATITGFMCFFQVGASLADCWANIGTNSVTDAPLTKSGMLDMLKYDININGPNPNFKVFYHDGVCHGEDEYDGNSLATDGSPSTCDFDIRSQDGVMFNDWVRGFAEVPGYRWEDVK